MRKFILVFVPLIFLVIGGVIGIFLWWNQAITAPGTSEEEQRIVITRGASSDTIGANLKEAGVIRDAFAFKIYLQLNGLVTSIPPGEFRIAQNLPLSEVVAELLEGPIELWVTIPEGFRREQIPLAFINSFEFSDSEAATFQEDFLSASEGLEGYLYPDTYLFSPDTTGAEAVKRLNDTFSVKFAPTQQELSSVGLTLNEVVILASIIERETLSLEERPEVAGVYINRLTADWPLQADATVQYVLGTRRCERRIECDWWKTPTAEDLRNTNSPYNTYQVNGLPPAPIANPGIASLKAVIQYEDTDNWFYIHDSLGQIYFAETLEEHNQNIARYLR